MCLVYGNNIHFDRVLQIKEYRSVNEGMLFSWQTKHIIIC